MSRPKSGASTAARPPSQAGAQPGVPAVRIDNKKNGVAQDALKQAVFDKPKVAKKVFQSMDKDKDKKLSQEEFVNGFKELMADELESGEVTEIGIESLWKQTDINLDGFISWEEFRIRFCEDAPRNFHLRQELQPPAEAHTTIMKALRPYIRILYDHSDAVKAARKASEIWTKLEFSESTKFNAKVLRAIAEAFGGDERKQAEAKGEAVPVWVTLFEAQTKDEISELLLEIETTNKGAVNLTRYDKRLNMVVELPVKAKLNYKRRLNEIKVKGGKKGSKKDDPPPSAPKSTSKGGKKGPKSAGSKPVVLKSIQQPNVQEWLCHEVFTAVAKERPDLPSRMAPSLKTWNINERTKWGLEHSDGSRCYILLSDSFDIKAMVRDEEKNVVIFCTYRLELNGLHTFEWLYHAKIHLDHKHEDVTGVESRALQSYKSGVEYPLPRGSKPDFRDWVEHVHVPDVFMPSVQPREY